MRKVPVIAEISDEHYKAYAEEAKRREVTVESLVQRTVDFLIREFESKQGHDPDRPVYIC